MEARPFALAVLAAALAGTAGSRPALSQVVPVDLELVLAVDVSSSVDLNEFHLQMQGLSEAFRHPDVIGAIESAGDLGIAVSLIQWSDWPRQRRSIEWTHIRGRPDAEAFADRVRRAARYGDGGSTGLGGAIRFGIAEIESNRFDGTRRTIDVSGDGVANQGAAPSDYRDRAVALGIVVNGLAILNDNPQLDRYYMGNVIGGHSAFVIAADDYYDFAEAILRKLVREIAGPPLAGRPPPGPLRVASPDFRAAGPGRGQSGPTPRH